MKMNKIYIFLVLANLTYSCNKKAKVVNPKTDLSNEIQALVPQNLLDTLQKKGLIINKGTLPPKIEGIFLVSPFTLVSNYGIEDSWLPGKIIDDYMYKFHSQNNENQEIKYDYKGVSNSDTGTGKGSFVSGNGNFFTIFSESDGKKGSLVTYKSIDVFSGEITDSGIKNLQYGLIMKEKTGDDSNVALIKIGKARVYKDGDNFATKVPVTNLRIANSNFENKLGKADASDF